MWKSNLLSCLLVVNVVVRGAPVTPEGTAIAEGENATLATDLVPPPIPATEGRHGIIYTIDLYAVTNETSDVPEDEIRSANDIAEPEQDIKVIGPIASLVVVVEDIDERVAEELKDDGYSTDDISLELQPPPLENDDSMSVQKSDSDSTNQKQMVRTINRRKRTLCKKCGYSGGGYGGGGYGGGGYGGGGYGHGQPTGGGGSYVVIPIVLEPVRGGGHGGGQGGYGHGQGGHRGHGGGGGYGGGGYPVNNNVHYPQQGGGGGCNTCGGGGGNSYSQASAQASASASAGSWGK